MSRVLILTGALLAAALPLSGRQAPARSTPPSGAQAVKGDIEHGRYLVERVAMCVECHSGRDAAGAIIPEQRYLGGSIPFRPPWPNDWATRAPRNAGLTAYTDAAAIRLLTEGAMGRDGQQLRAPMPRFRMSLQDALDVIAFLRSM